MNQVAVTGMGVVSPIGSGVPSFWEALLGGRHAFRPIPNADGLGGNRLWAAVPDSFTAAPGVTAPMLRNSDRFTAYAMVATVEALTMAGLAGGPPPLTAVILGNTMGGLPLFAEAQTELERRPQHVTPKLMALVIPSMAAARISLHWGLHGRQLTISTACASSLDAIGLAARMIERGEAEQAIAGGTETLLAPVVYQSLDRARALSRVTDPDHASRPFDVERDGFVMGDGAAVLVLEHEGSARRRGARVLARVRGYGSLTDAHHLTAPEPSGRYEAEAIRAALEDAGCEVQTVFAHATGTVVGDIAELRAINTVLGSRRPRVTALRGHLGHAMAAAGATSVVAGILGMEAAVMPQTLGTRNVEPEACFDVVLGEPRRRAYREFSVNAFGFGGQNASLVLSA
ncbi:MAG: beta-ketoacyl-[acyl-carrier-protein] synthase family protein [Steroidobacteraceae bacterium]